MAVSSWLLEAVEPGSTPSSACVQPTFSITPLIRPNPFNEPETQCDLGLRSKVSCDTGLSPMFRTRESMTPGPFYCIFFLMWRQKTEFIFISFCKTPPYVSGLQLRRMQVFGSHAGSRLGKRKAASGPCWLPSSCGLHQRVLQVIKSFHSFWFLSSTQGAPCSAGHPTCTALPWVAGKPRPSSHGCHSS